MPVQIIPYSFHELAQQIAACTRQDPAIVRKKSHLAYFESYFAYYQTDAITIVVENDYVDHDFMDDYAAYYVRCLLGKYSSTCTRLHFFTKDFSADDLFALASNAPSSLNAISLQEAYLGFIVVRPIPSTFVGRTCLRTYGEDGHRHYPVTRTYEAHLLGLRLTVTSLAFQEQDRIVAACATSALWSVLHGTGVLFHHAIPSPVQITRIATEFYALTGRTFPNHGLYPEQMCGVIRHVGLEPEMVQVKTEELLKATAYAYLRAGIPLLMNSFLHDMDDPDAPSEGHAVGLTGYSFGPYAIPHPTTGTLLCSSKIDKFYVHDDQVGPFARLEFGGPTISMNINGIAPTDVSLTLKSSWIGRNGTRDSVLFNPFMLILPLYNKIRIGIASILNRVFELNDELERLRNMGVGSPRWTKPLEWDVFLCLGHELKANLRDENLLGPDELVSYLNASLPRFLWRARALLDQVPAFELLYDATDIEQGNFLLGLLQYDRDFCGQVFGEPAPTS